MTEPAEPLRVPTQFPEWESAVADQRAYEERAEERDEAVMDRAKEQIAAERDAAYEQGFAEGSADVMADIHLWECGHLTRQVDDYDVCPHCALTAIARRVALAATPFISCWEFDVWDFDINGEDMHADLLAALRITRDEWQAQR